MSEALPGQLNLEGLKECNSVYKYRKLAKIGEGTYGHVFKAQDIATGEIVALKRVRMDKEKEGFPLTAIREIAILKKLEHQNVIRLKEVVTSLGPAWDRHGNPPEEKTWNGHGKLNGSTYMVFEYMDHDLTGLFQRPDVHFTVPQVKCYMKQLLEGLHYCHTRQILHRDLKGANLLINNNGSLKLADFGLARSFEERKVPGTNIVITLWYRPPELLLGSSNYGPAIDMWSVGCIFAELLHGKAIMPGKNEADQLSRIFELCGSPDDFVWPGVSKLKFFDIFKPARLMKRRVREVFKHFDQDALDLLDWLLALDPDNRPTAVEALHAKYFWKDPLPSDPSSLPKYEPSHEYETKKKRRKSRHFNRQKRQANERVRWQRAQEHQPNSRPLAIDNHYGNLRNGSQHRNNPLNVANQSQCRRPGGSYNQNHENQSTEYGSMHSQGKGHGGNHIQNSGNESTEYGSMHSQGKGHNGNHIQNSGNENAGYVSVLSQDGGNDLTHVQGSGYGLGSWGTGYPGYGQAGASYCGENHHHGEGGPYSNIGAGRGNNDRGYGYGKP